MALGRGTARRRQGLGIGLGVQGRNDVAVVIAAVAAVAQGLQVALQGVQLLQQLHAYWMCISWRDRRLTSRKGVGVQSPMSPSKGTVAYKQPVVVGTMRSRAMA